MSNVSISDISKLREETGLGIMDVKKALIEADGDLIKAKENLKKSGALKAAKKSERASTNGLIEAYVHAQGKIGVIVEVSCETDFVAKNQDFKDFVHDIALHIAAVDPKYLSIADVPESELKEEKQSILENLKSEGKPQAIVEKILEGKLQKLYSELCLLEQPFVKDPEQTIGEYLTSNIAKIGENIIIKRFARFAVGC